MSQYVAYPKSNPVLSYQIKPQTLKTPLNKSTGLLSQMLLYFEVKIVLFFVLVLSTTTLYSLYPYKNVTFLS